MKVVQSTIIIEEKFSDISKTFRVGPKKVGSVGFRKRDIYFFFGLIKIWTKTRSHKKNKKKQQQQQKKQQQQ